MTSEFGNKLLGKVDDENISCVQFSNVSLIDIFPHNIDEDVSFKK
jgi:hypothetical protein